MQVLFSFPCMMLERFPHDELSLQLSLIKQAHSGPDERENTNRRSMAASYVLATRTSPGRGSELARPTFRGNASATTIVCELDTPRSMVG